MHTFLFLDTEFEKDHEVELQEMLNVTLDIG